MKKLATLLIVLLSFTTFSQSEAVEIIAEKSMHQVTFFGRNNTETSQEVVLTLNHLDDLSGYKEPIKKDLPAGAKVKLITLNSETGRYTFSKSYTYEPAYLAKEKALKLKQLKERKNIRNGIVIFNKTGCSRCSYTTNYLASNKIDFRVLSTKEKENKHLMIQLLRENGIVTSVLMPVVLIDGKLANSQGDIEAFVKTLK